jgi:hypothetical protein
MTAAYIFFLLLIIGQGPNEELTDPMMAPPPPTDPNEWTTLDDRYPRMITVHGANHDLVSYYLVTGSAGKETERVAYNMDGTIINRETFEYDRHGNLSERRVYTGYDTLKQVDSYDWRGARLMKRTRSDIQQGGEAEADITYLNGLLNQVELKKDGRTVAMEQYVYYPHNWELQQTRFFESSSGQMKLAYKWNYIRDDRRRIQRIVQLSENDTPQQTMIYWYLEHLDHQITRLVPESQRGTIGIPQHLPLTNDQTKRLEYHTIVWINPSGNLTLESNIVLTTDLKTDHSHHIPLVLGWSLHGRTLPAVQNRITFSLTETTNQTLLLKNDRYDLAVQIFSY